MCPCGQPLHYPNKSLEEMVLKIIADLGPDIKVTVLGHPGEYTVPRHWIALHSLKPGDLPSLLERGIAKRSS